MSEPIKAAGILDTHGIEGLIGEMTQGVLYSLDFSGVSDISFASMRALLRCRRSGVHFSIINASDAVARRFEESGVSSYISVTRRPEPLDLQKYAEFGGGFLSTAYNSIDGDSMLKVYGANVPEEVVIREKNVARALMLFGLNTPMVGTIYEHGDSKGIDFERIEGKRSFSRIMSEEPERIEELTVRFAHMCKELHNTNCDTEIFSDRKILYRSVIEGSTAVNAAQKAEVLAFIDSIPDATTCLHGDMQPSNVITNGKEDFWIDLSDFGYGCPMMDLGMWYFLALLNPEELSQHIFHLSKQQMHLIWDIFIREYFGADTPEKKEEVHRSVEPYAALHMLYLGTQYGFKPGMMEFISKTLFPAL